MICENLYQVFLYSQRNELLDQVAVALYGKGMSLTEEERITFFIGWLRHACNCIKLSFREKSPNDNKIIPAHFTVGTSYIIKKKLQS